MFWLLEGGTAETLEWVTKVGNVLSLSGRGGNGIVGALPKADKGSG